MNSRQEILSRIRAGKPGLKPLPVVDLRGFTNEQPVLENAATGVSPVNRQPVLENVATSISPVNGQPVLENVETGFNPVTRQDEVKMPGDDPGSVYTKRLLQKFITNLAAGGGAVVQVDTMQDVKSYINEQKQTGSFIINVVPQAGSIDPIPAEHSVLAGLAQVYILGSLAVAENGAVWVPESSMLNRILPFITEQLYLVLDKSQLVATMHDAYERIRIDEDGFGVFIAGPSKTADIEQSLVIGAHGPRQMMVLMITGS